MSDDEAMRIQALKRLYAAMKNGARLIVGRDADGDTWGIWRAGEPDDSPLSGGHRTREIARQALRDAKAVQS